MNEQEVWKDVKGYEGVYQISNLGEIKRLSYSIIRNNGYKQSWKEKKLKPTKDAGGYLGIRSGTKKNGKSYTLRIHRLVAEAFIPNPNRYNYINHIDGNKQNNRVNNLEWCTHEYNIKKAWEDGLCDGLKKKINQYDLNGNFIASYPSIREAERKTGVRNTGINGCLHNVYKSSGGFVWKYADNN